MWLVERPMPDVIRFELPMALPSLNRRDRQHWSVRRREKQQLTLEVVGAIGGPARFPPAPWPYAKIVVTRRSAGRLDHDNLYASFKALGDVLQKLKIIETDASDRLHLVMRQGVAKRGQASTLVTIEGRSRPFLFG